MLHEAEELAEPTRAHLWNKGIEIQSNLCTVVSYETHCYIQQQSKHWKTEFTFSS